MDTRWKPQGIPEWRKQWQPPVEKEAEAGMDHGPLASVRESGRYILYVLIVGGALVGSASILSPYQRNSGNAQVNTNANNPIMSPLPKEKN